MNISATRRYLLFSTLFAGGSALGQAFQVVALSDLGYAAQSVTLLGGLQLSQLGLLISAPTAAAALVALPLWRWVLYAGGGRALTLAAVLQAAALLTFALLPPWPYLALGMALSGPAGVLLTLAAAPTMLALADGPAADRLFSRVAAAALGAAAAAQALVGVAADVAAGAGGDAAALRFRSAAAAGAALLGVAALLPGRLRPGGRAAAAEHRQITRFFFPDHLRQLRRAVLPALAPLLTSLGAALFVPFIGVYLQTDYGADDRTLGFIYATITISTGLATLMAPRLAARVGRVGAVLASQLPAIGALVLLPFAPTLWVAGGLAALRSALMNLALPLYDAEMTARAAEELRPTQAAVMRGAGNAGYLIGPSLSVALQAQAGFSAVIWLTAGLYLASAAVLWRLARRDGPVWYNPAVNTGGEE